MNWKSALKLMAVPIILVGIGAWLALAAWKVFPKGTHENTVTSFPHVIIAAEQHPLFIVRYDIYQVSRQKWLMQIEVDLEPGASPSGAVGVSVLPPLGATFVCPKSSQRCGRHQWTKAVSFDDNGNSKIASFYLKATHISVGYNGPEASAPLPTVGITTTGKTAGNPVLMASYYLPSARRYDWAVDPPANIFTSKGRIQWEEALNSHGFTAGRSIVGTNHAALDDNTNKALAAGILAGVAGAAWVGALIEVVHARDWEALRAVRRQ
jgi:hypothetical protein